MPARPAPSAVAVGERELERLAARVLRDGDHCRRAEAFGEETADDVPGPFGATISTSWPGGAGIRP